MHTYFLVFAYRMRLADFQVQYLKKHRVTQGCPFWITAFTTFPYTFKNDL